MSLRRILASPEPTMRLALQAMSLSLWQRCWDNEFSPEARSQIIHVTGPQVAGGHVGVDRCTQRRVVLLWFAVKRERELLQLPDQFVHRLRCGPWHVLSCLPPFGSERLHWRYPAAHAVHLLSWRALSELNVADTRHVSRSVRENSDSPSSATRIQSHPCFNIEINTHMMSFSPHRALP